MKKFFKQLLSVVLVVLFCTVCVVMPVSATTTATKTATAKKYYKKYLPKYGKYVYCDLNGDGVPELLIKQPSYSKVYTFNYKKKKVVLLKSLATGKCNYLLYNKSKHQIGLVESSTGHATTIFYKVNSSSLVKKATYFNSHEFKNGKMYYTCKINGKKSTKKTYDSKYNAAKKGFKSLVS